MGVGVGVGEEVLGGGGEKNEEGLRLTNMTEWVAHTFPAKPDPLIQAIVIQNKAQVTENKAHVTENKVHVTENRAPDRKQSTCYRKQGMSQKTGRMSQKTGRMYADIVSVTKPNPTTHQTAGCHSGRARAEWRRWPLRWLPATGQSAAAFLQRLAQWCRTQ